MVDLKVNLRDLPGTINARKMSSESEQKNTTIALKAPRPLMDNKFKICIFEKDNKSVRSINPSELVN